MKLKSLIAVVLGIIAGLGFAPLHWGILALAAYPCIYRLAFPPESENHMRSALLVYLFYVGNYAVSLFWIGEAPAHYDENLWWFGIIAMVIIPPLLALFMLPAAYSASLMPARFGQLPRMLVFIMALSVAEYLRGTLFTGFAWNMPAHLLLGSAPLLQNVAWAGLYGANLLMLMVLILPATLFYRGKQLYAGAGISLLLLVAGFGYGWLKITNEPPAAESPYGIRIVQPNISGDERFDRDKITDNIVTAIELSRKDRPDWVQAVIWGEAVVPFDFTTRDDWRNLLATAAPKGGIFIAGATRYDRTTERFYNSMLGINDKGEKLFTYDKHHLVPFGEYVPFSDILPLPAIAAEGNAYDKGTPPATVAIDNMPSFIPLICYEIIFPKWRSRAYKADPSAQFILNLTNDEWYQPDLTGIAVGFYQHLQMARFSAVQSGLPVVRAASTGISAIIDTKGRIINPISYAEQGWSDTLLPASQPSFSLQYGFVIFLVLLSILLLALVIIVLYSRVLNPKS